MDLTLYGRNSLRPMKTAVIFHLLHLRMVMIQLEQLMSQTRQDKSVPQIVMVKVTHFSLLRVILLVAVMIQLRL